MVAKLKPHDEIALLNRGLTIQLETNDNLSFLLNETEFARDKALFYLLRFCEVSEREGWALSEEATQMRECALDVLCENNIFTGLPEPDEAILRLLEVVSESEVMS